MKKYLKILLLLLLCSVFAYASNPFTKTRYSSINQLVGCGLGTQAFRNDSNRYNSLELTVANTLNNWSSTQLSGITSGTSGCKTKGLFANNNAQLVHDYIATNMEQFMIDASYGDGKTLDVLASLIEPKNVAEFKMKVHSNFNKIFTNENISTQEVTNNLYGVII